MTDSTVSVCVGWALGLASTALISIWQRRGGITFEQLDFWFSRKEGSCSIDSWIYAHNSASTAKTFCIKSIKFYDGGRQFVCDAYRSDLTIYASSVREVEVPSQSVVRFHLTCSAPWHERHKDRVAALSAMADRIRYATVVFRIFPGREAAATFDFATGHSIDAAIRDGGDLRKRLGDRPQVE